MQRRTRTLILIVPLLLLVLLVAYACWPKAARTPQPEGPVDLSQVMTKAPEYVAPYSASEAEAVAAMLDMAAVGPRDYLIDLGSGDGRIPIAAARDRGARALGVDIDPARIRDSRLNAERAGVTDKVRFIRQDLFQVSITDATVLALYLTRDINLRLRDRILTELRPGTRVVSNMFDMGDWRWDERRRAGDSNIYLWIVPARVEGPWRLRQNGRDVRLSLEQEFQQLEGSVVVDGRSREIEEGLIRGDRVRFVADIGGGRRLFEGRVQGNTIVPVTGERPSYPVEPATGWQAVRGG